MTDFDLSAYLAREAERIEKALEDLGRSLSAATPPALFDPMHYALGTRGKRLRPILCCTAFRVLSGAETPPQVYRLACALEVVHTYSLVHDDLPCMDDDDMRRGRPTVHRVFGSDRAVLAGAALLPFAVRILTAEAAALGLEIAERGRLVEELCAAAGAEGMVGGQLLDLEGEESPVDAAGLEAIHRAKTGALLKAALRIGALAARASDRELEAVSAYGEAIGLAFQIADDILDVVGESEALGKTAGRDESLGKATYPALFGLDGARALATQRSNEAVAALRAAEIRSPALEALARYVVEREK